IFTVWLKLPIAGGNSPKKAACEPLWTAGQAGPPCTVVNPGLPVTVQPGTAWSRPCSKPPLTISSCAAAGHAISAIWATTAKARRRIGAEPFRAVEIPDFQPRPFGPKPFSPRAAVAAQPLKRTHGIAIVAPRRARKHYGTGAGNKTA